MVLASVGVTMEIIPAKAVQPQAINLPCRLLYRPSFVTMDVKKWPAHVLPQSGRVAQRAARVANTRLRWGPRAGFVEAALPNHDCFILPGWKLQKGYNDIGKTHCIFNLKQILGRCHAGCMTTGGWKLWLLELNQKLHHTTVAALVNICEVPLFTQTYANNETFAY